MKKIALSLLILFSLGNSSAQTPTQTVKGRLTDAESGQPVFGASVIISTIEPILGSTTDESGYFRIESVPVGRHTIKISSIGYEDAVLQEISIGSGKEVELNVKLTESLQNLDEVTIKAQKQTGDALNDMTSVSARSFSVDQSKRYAAAINDPARMALSFAGVATSDDTNNQIIIRGNSPKGLLWRMEGVEIPNPNHFAEEGSTGGGVSALSVNVLGNSDFLTGAFPAEYGNATSGVFDLKLRNGNAEKREYALQAGVLGLDFAAEGPIKKGSGASYLANYRYSTLSILNAFGIEVAGDGVLNFQDGAFKVFIPQKKQATLSVWGMGGLSSQRTDKTNFREDYHSDRGVLGLNYVRYLNQKSYMETILSYSATRQTFDYTNKNNDDWDQEQYINQALRLTLNYNYKLNARHALRAGVIASHLSFNLLDKFRNQETTRTLLDQAGSTQLMQAFAQWKYRVSPTLTLNSGVHGLWLALNGQASVEPRLGLRWSVAPRHTLSFGTGLHSRTESISTYLAQVQVGEERTAAVNENLKLTKSAHLVAGYEFRPAQNWRIQTETYYQRHFNVPIGPVGTNRPYLLASSFLNAISGYANDSLVSDGTGRSYGLELTVEKFLTGGIYFMSTTSLYQSKYTARDGVERNSRFNGNFVQNLLAGKEWAVGRNKKNIFAFNVKGVWAGGNRVTPIDLAKSRKNQRTVYDWSRSYADRLPYYFRTDLRVSYTKNSRRTTSTFSLDIQNVSNRLNAQSRYYDPGEDKIDYFTQMGLIPVLNYRLEF
ncbi:carboxypeptidase-like regulatory domain-containing protein [Persicitalea sp.]|uniref:TonB-dependent receptor n=1 Tax=Persicitalea sp. TaxID=3100273 RepID=UPI003593F13F